MGSQIKTVALLALLSGIIIVMGGVIGGQLGIIIALGFALVMNISSYWFSDKIVLKMYGASEISEADAPNLYRMVGELAQKANIPMPRICIIPEQVPNAFATGRDPQHGVVAVTEGLMALLTPDEVRGVVAHELGHIANRDILIQTVAGVLASAIVAIANIMQFTAIFGGKSDGERSGNPLAMLAMIILAPLAASLIQFGISRSREYLADSTGGRISQNPLALASALEKISDYAAGNTMQHGNSSTAHMFIINPFSAKRMASLFSTHPPTAERIARLRAQASQSNGGSGGGVVGGNDHNGDFR